MKAVAIWRKRREEQEVREHILRCTRRGFSARDIQRRSLDLEKTPHGSFIATCFVTPGFLPTSTSRFASSGAGNVPPSERHPFTKGKFSSTLSTTPFFKRLHSSSQFLTDFNVAITTYVALTSEYSK